MPGKGDNAICRKQPKADAAQMVPVAFLWYNSIFQWQSNRSQG
jgi:hypothetical protein